MPQKSSFRSRGPVSEAWPTATFKGMTVFQMKKTEQP
jgi:hypothetical protein